MPPYLPQNRKEKKKKTVTRPKLAWPLCSRLTVENIRNQLRIIYKAAAKKRSDWTAIFLAPDNRPSWPGPARPALRSCDGGCVWPPVELNRASVTGLAGSARSCVPYHCSPLCVQASTEVRPRRVARPSGRLRLLIGRTMKGRPCLTPPPAAHEEWLCFSSNSLPVGATAGQIGQH